MDKHSSGLFIPSTSTPKLTEYKKADPPVLGDKFGTWVNSDLHYFTLPGGAVMQFDLSRLTLADYRAMRDHYQVNTNLTLLSFMIHQIDWKIECERKEIATEIEEQLRHVWSQLIRGISQAFWSGYSPMALEYRNDVQDRRVRINKVKDLPPEHARVNWRYVDGYSENKSKPKIPIYDGIAHTAGGGTIPVDNCVHPDTPLLMADMTWKRAGDARIGDEILAFDEDDQPRGRQYRKAHIVENRAGRKPSVEVRLDAAREAIIASTDHPFLVRQPASKPGNQRDPITGRMVKAPGKTYYKDCWIWKNAEDLKPGDKVAWFGQPWDFDDTREAGWLAGMFDGEGSLSRNQLSISQNNGPVLERLKKSLSDRGYEFSATSNDRDDCVQLVVQGGVRSILKFLSEIQCSRIPAEIDLIDGTWLKIGKSVDLAEVTSVEPVGEQPVASIQTSCGTFITGGALTHNSLWYPLLMENGDWYGRKLLRPAFIPWFFSNLIHLFANRYFERFGEPLPIGRAPFDDQVEVNGKVLTGRDAMNQILADLRSRSVVTLPSEREPERGNYEYDVEYLESQMRGADWERYLTRLDEEISLGLFTPILMLRTADVGSYNLGVNHMQVWMWMLNALAGDIKMYMDRYIVERIKAFNYGPNAPRATWEYRKMGKSNEETMRTIVAAMFGDGKVGVKDLDELGQYLGLELKEIRQVRADDPSQTDENGNPLGGRGEENDTTEPSDDRSPRVEASMAVVGSIYERISGQAGKAERDGEEFNPTLGYRRKMQDALIADGFTGSEAQRIVGEVYGDTTEFINDLQMDDYSRKAKHIEQYVRSSLKRAAGEV